MIPIDFSNQLSIFKNFLKYYYVHSIKLEAAGKAKNVKDTFYHIREIKLYSINSD